MWNGDENSILSWIRKVNFISQRSEQVFEELGQMIPLRLEGRASQWFFSLPADQQQQFQWDWNTIKFAIAHYFMNHHWLTTMKSKAIRMRYRQKNHETENPTDYFIRKLELLQLVFDLNDAETIMEIMNGVPREWLPYIDTQRMQTVQELQNAIKYHEDTLIRITSNDFDRRLKALEGSSNRSSRFKGKTYTAETNFVRRKSTRKPFKGKLIGSHPSFAQPTLPKRDDIISKGKTPEQKGARPCRHCGSGKHWDFDHPLNGKDRKARVFLADLDSEALDAFVAYEQCWAEDDEESEADELPDIEEEEEPTEISEDEDFPEPLA